MATLQYDTSTGVDLHIHRVCAEAHSGDMDLVDDLLRYTKIYQDIPEYTPTYQNIPGHGDGLHACYGNGNGKHPNTIFPRCIQKVELTGTVQGAAVLSRTVDTRQ